MESTSMKLSKFVKRAKSESYCMGKQPLAATMACASALV